MRNATSTDYFVRCYIIWSNQNIQSCVLLSISQMHLSDWNLRNEEKSNI